MHTHSTTGSSCPSAPAPLPGNQNASGAIGTTKEPASFRPLPEQFFDKGFHHRQLGREGLVAIYERWHGEHHRHFEVIIVDQCRAWTIKGRRIEAAELYPSASAFGSTAFVYQSEDAAWAKFRELVAKEALGMDGADNEAGTQ